MWQIPYKKQIEDMNNMIEIHSVPYKGELNRLQSFLENAKRQGADYYECVSGRIAFYRTQTEKEHLIEKQRQYTEIMNKAKETLEQIQNRMKEI
jgi:23S rRNA A1618 N6-methylase RlmF